MERILFYVTSNAIGTDHALGTRLAQSFWNSLGERLTNPAVFAFINEGVLLTIEGSPVLASLRELERRGSQLLSCGTCLDYYRDKGTLAVGEIGSMARLQELMLAAPKVVKL
ncbi:MAG: hypothetical protein Kow00129_09840 [Thermoleophilia bacterium]